MSARLRFAIAVSKAHQVLLIDEALAVGDADFRAKSQARIKELREEAGTGLSCLPLDALDSRRV